MNLSVFAPDDFKEHLKVLENKAKFNSARIRCELGFTASHQHYVLTGNEGVGKDDAVQEIYQRMTGISDIESCVTKDAVSMFDANDGFGSAMSNACQDNILLHIKNADRLGMRSNVNPKNGIEELCDRMPKMKNCVVVLSGKRNQLLELVKGNENAKEWFTYMFNFDDLTPEAMFQYMVEFVNSKNYLFDPATEPVLKDYLYYTYKLRGSNFRNVSFLQDIFDKEIVPRMSQRVMKQNLPPEQLDLCTIMPEDIPEVRHLNTEEAIRKLESLVGLDEIKKQILDHTALVKLNNLRATKGMYNKMPPMHMVFTGNPGTGKTTIAKHIGEIYHSIGVLSSGHVVVTDRTKLVGEYIGMTEKNALNAINSASGGVLFIDEAYNLFTESESKRDFGMRVIETLLTYLGNDDTDMIVILAGYSEEMKQMLESNPGMKSRFPYIFKFEDYIPEQLMQIGKMVLEREHYTLSPEAERKLGRYVINAYDHKDEHFGNGRFITRLITTQIIPSLSRRLLKKPIEEISIEEMTTIQACDIPEVVSHERKARDLDDTVLTEALERLNKLIGLQHAKQALNDYVSISRLRHSENALVITPLSLCWDFIGKTGTGKSTVAEILGKILQGLGILKRGHTVSVNADELTGDDGYLVLTRVIKEAKDGLLFLDMDAPNSRFNDLNHLRMWIFNKLRELQQTTALVFAQVKASEDMIAQNLATNGVASYGNTIVFNDFTVSELSEILVSLLQEEYQLGIIPEAQAKVLNYIESVKKSETRESPVNARTIFHLAQTIANITQLRLVKSGGDRLVTPQDVYPFSWDNKVKGRVGFILS